MAFKEFNFSKGLWLDDNSNREGFLGSESENLYLKGGVPTKLKVEPTNIIHKPDEYGETEFIYGTPYWDEFHTTLMIQAKKLYKYDYNLQCLERVWGGVETDFTNYSRVSACQIFGNYVFTLGRHNPLYEVNQHSLKTFFEPTSSEYYSLRPECLVEWQDSVFMASIYNSKQDIWTKRRLIWTEVGDYKTIRPSSFMDIVGYGRIRKLQVCQDMLLVFCDDGLHYIQYVGQGIYFRRHKLLDADFSNPEMVTGNTSLCVFYSKDLYVFDASTGTPNLKKIPLAGCSSLQEQLEQYGTKAKMVFDWYNGGIVFIVSDTSSDNSYFYHVDLNGTLQGKLVVPESNVTWVASDPHWSNYFYFYNTTNNMIYKHIVPFWNQVGGISNKMICSTGWTDFQILPEKIIRRVVVYCQASQPESLKLNLYKNYELDGVEYTGTMEKKRRDFNEVQKITYDFYGAGVSGHCFKFDLEYAGDAVKIYSFLVDYDQAEDY